MSKICDINSHGCGVVQGDSTLLVKDQLVAQPGRYRLIWADMCPWSQRIRLLLNLLDLDAFVSSGKVAPTKDKIGWNFSTNPYEKDPVLQVKHLVDTYYKVDKKFTGRATVPSLIDVVSGKVVNNDVENLTVQLRTTLAPLQGSNALELYPPKLSKEIDDLNRTILLDINHGVYRLHHVNSDMQRRALNDQLFDRLEWLNERLKDQKYLFGNILTETDVRLYPTLARFDVVYNPLFHENRYKLSDLPNLWRYARDLYSIPIFHRTTNFPEIRRGYDTDEGYQNFMSVRMDRFFNQLWCC
jgi:Predicted glutathione S-transferase